MTKARLTVMNQFFLSPMHRCLNCIQGNQNLMYRTQCLKSIYNMTNQSELITQVGICYLCYQNAFYYESDLSFFPVLTSQIIAYKLACI